jgi:hypothetical protein
MPDPAPIRVKCGVCDHEFDYTPPPPAPVKSFSPTDATIFKAVVLQPSVIRCENPGCQSLIAIQPQFRLLSGGPSQPPKEPPTSPE